MTTTPSTDSPSSVASPAIVSPSPSPSPSTRSSENVSSMFAHLEGPGGALDSLAHFDHENQLAQVRLGIASGLFAALQAKHAASAAHSVRVALGCSTWAISMKLPSAQMDELEVAALLHDVGKIGVPDNVLLKPGKLNASEGVLMGRQRDLGLAILKTCCSSEGVLDTIRYAAAWFDGSHGDFDLSGEELPLTARMLSIADAFDSMTTDHIYRRAMSRERATRELFEHSGSQFDPKLVKQFCDLQESDQQELHASVTRRWLEELDGNAITWKRENTIPAETTDSSVTLFHEKLLDNMQDGVAFIDSNLQIQLWNRGAERLTGVPGTSIFERSWLPSLIGLREENGRQIHDEECPVRFVLESGVQSLRRLLVTNQDDQQVSIDMHIVPVIGRNGTTYGADVLFRDASGEASLEERCQNLQDKVTRDPLTQVANRAEFDRAHKRFIETHLKRKRPCSLIICDIDHFKRVNDNYGHQAGDEAIKTMAQLMKQMCRPGDLVARYGGEEFVVLCADCDNANAARRSEQIRRALSDLPLPMLGGNRITASFGVTEIQPGDSDVTMLRRADRALLMAKESGRNNVIQLGVGSQDEATHKESRWSWFGSSSTPDKLLERDLTTPVPLKVAVEKLRGFVADHHALIEEIEENTVMLRIEPLRAGLLRRNTDRPVGFLLEFNFSEEEFEVETRGVGHQAIRTKVHVVIRPKRDRDRRRNDALTRARHLMASVRSYLMAVEVEDESDTSVLKRATAIVSAWLHKD